MGNGNCRGVRGAAPKPVLQPVCEVLEWELHCNNRNGNFLGKSEMGIVEDLDRQLPNQFSNQCMGFWGFHWNVGNVNFPGIWEMGIVEAGVRGAAPEPVLQPVCGVLGMGISLEFEK